MSEVERQLAAIGRRRILFAHQSVGANMLEGLAALEPAVGRVPLVTYDRAAQSWTGIASARLGKNGAPQSKTEAFGAAISDSPMVEIAIHKYCYVDLDRNGDATELFRYYRDRMQALAERQPATTILHMTMPLMAIESGARAVVKRLLGRPLDQVEDNAAREAFNDLLRAQYPADRMFDLAAHESAAKRPYALRQDLTSDGGHLNARGRRQVAGRFLSFLATAAGRSSASSGR